MEYLLHGFLLGIAYVAPIGMQNMFVINSAVVKTRKEAYQVAFITIFFDVLLALACFFGMGLIMEKSEFLKGGILLIGSLAIIYIGISLIRSTPKLDEKVDVNKSMLKIIGIIFTVTWLNPQALIDGSLLIGGVRASLSVEASRLFIIGVALASFSWFTGVTTVVVLFKNVFTIKILKIINIISGIVIIFYGGKLLIDFISIIFK